MKGLEIREGLFSETIKNKDFRIDSQYYTQAPVKNQKLKYKKIGGVIHSSQYGLSIEMNEDMCGYPIYRMNELHDMLCDLEVNKYADIPQEEYQRFALKNRDVLFNRTNSFEWVGRTGIYYQNDNIERTFASYLVRFNPKENIILPEYLCAFLNSKRGAQDIKRRARQSINQTNVNPEEVKEIEIPILNMDFQLKIKEYFEKANLYRLKSLTLYKNAENQLLEELGLKDWQPKNDNVSIKTFSDFNKTGRLDAEYYQKKYDEYEKKLDNYGTVELEKLCKIQDKNFNPVGNSSYSYIELSNIGNNGEITGFTEMMGSELPSRARILVCEGDLLVSSIEGSLKSCAIVSKEYDKALCSTGFYVLTPTHMNVETMLLLFKSAPIQDLMRKRCSGTILTAISKDELLKIKLPDVRKEIQRQISSKIQESFALQSESKRLLEEAKMLVEKEIEK